MKTAMLLITFLRNMDSVPCLFKCWIHPIIMFIGRGSKEQKLISFPSKWSNVSTSWETEKKHWWNPQISIHISKCTKTCLINETFTKNESFHFFDTNIRSVEQWHSHVLQILSTFSGYIFKIFLEHNVSFLLATTICRIKKSILDKDTEELRTF